ncbi:MAG: secretion protein HylD [Methylibium sp. NZG]|nr:MAG: secretion protein HylD [Methylibium sp. NZG]
MRKLLNPITARVFGSVPAELSAADRGFQFEAEAILARQRSRRARAIVYSGVAVCAALGVWAHYAHVDEVTRGDAKVVPSRQLQVIQALDGGVVSEILVKEGQQVEAGQLLLRIDQTRATSGVRENAAQSFALLARERRLRALAEGTAFVPPPAAGNAEQQRIIDEERRLFEARRSELGTLVSISREQLSQREHELAEARSRRVSAQGAMALAQQELARTKPLLASGAVSEVEVLRLEREVNKNRGDVDQAAAQIARVQAAIGEARRKIEETDISFRNEARKELADVMGRANALVEGQVALTDKVDKALVKSPVRGRVQRLLANTVGGVVQPGRDIVEVVPLEDALVLDARVAPKDIAFIHPGQVATVKFSAYDFAIYGGLEATVENISPDTVVDDKGNAFYMVRVRTRTPNFGANLPIIPGMTAEVDVLTGKKSVLSYLLKPVLRGKAYALTER